MEKQPDTPKEERQLISSLINITKMLSGIVILIIAGIIFLTFQLSTGNPEQIASGQATAASQKSVTVEKASVPPADAQIKEGKDVGTGLLADEGMQIVKSTCTACHSSRLILQNRFTREGWQEKIVWMQETQGLWDLGENEEVILDYLAANYAPKAFKGRRLPLRNIEWYTLED